MNTTVAFSEQVEKLIKKQKKEMEKMFDPYYEHHLEKLNEMFEEMKPYIKEADFLHSNHLDQTILMVVTRHINDIIMLKREIIRYMA